jgi:hypothetical protein
MSKTLSLDVIMQQLDTLSLAELLKVRDKVKALIEENYQTISSVSDTQENMGIPITIQAPYHDDSLEKVTELVNQWVNDHSGYDEEAYPQIEAALNQNYLSL